jgi:vitamin B12 transporter
MINISAFRIIVCSLLLLTLHLFAQDDDSLQVYQHDDIVVTATRSEKHISDVSRSLSLISKADLDNNVYISPVEALSQQEGVFVVGNGQNPGALQNIYLRGVNTNSTVVLVDGVRLTDPSSVDNSINLSELSLLNVDHIEMIRGAHSTLYGSSAIGGVINLITERNRKAGFNAEFYTQLGTFGKGTALFNQDLLLNYTFLNGLYISAAIYNSDIQGFDATTDTVTRRSVYNKPDKDNFKKRDFMSRVGFTNNQFDAWLTYRRSDQKADIDRSAYTDDDNATLDFSRDLVSYSAAYKWDDQVTLALNGGYSDMRRTAVNDSSVIDNRGNTDQTYSRGIYGGTTFTNDIQVNIFDKDFNAVIGAEQYSETMTSYDYIYSNSIFGVYEAETNLDDLNLETTTNNVFAHVDLNGKLAGALLSDFTLALGGRYIDHSSFGRTFTYEINPSLKISDGIIYGSVASGFNAPSLYRLYSPSANYISGLSLGNKDLKPEKSVSFELGIRQKIEEDYTFSVAVFNTKIEDVHEYVYLWDSNIAIDSLGNDWLRDDYRGDTYINAGTMTIQGLEIGFDTKLFYNLIFSGNISWIKGNQKFSLADINNNQTNGYHVQSFNNGSFIGGSITANGLARRANTANFSLVYNPFPFFSVAMMARYVGKRNDVFYDAAAGPYGALGTREATDFTLFDLSARYDINRQIKATMRVENLLDTEYYEIKGYNSRGRSFYLGLRYTL